MSFANTRTILAAVIVAAFTAMPVAPTLAAEGDADAIATLIRKTWETPERKIDIAPIVTSGDHALAGWVQGNRGGRALLRRNGDRWSVVLCSGDAIRSADALASAGVPATAAAALARDMAAREAEMSAAHVARFSLFEATIPMDGAEGHDAHIDHQHHNTQH